MTDLISDFDYNLPVLTCILLYLIGLHIIYQVYFNKHLPL